MSGRFQQRRLFLIASIGFLNLSLSISTAQTGIATPAAVSMDTLFELSAGNRYCRSEADSLRAIRDLLFNQAETIAVNRSAAIAAGNETEEKDLLARGQVVSEAIQFLSESIADRDQACRDGLERFDSQLATYRPNADRSEIASLDSLQQIHLRLARSPAMTLSQLNPPRIAPDDTPETLRWKADFTQDLIDRVHRWRATIAGERDRLAQQQRIRNEAANLLRDEQFLDPGASGDMIGGGGAIGWQEYEDELSGALSGMISELIVYLAGDYADASADEILSMTDEWLRRKFMELVNLAQYLEQMARRREREP